MPMPPLAGLVRKEWGMPIQDAGAVVPSALKIILPGILSTHSMHKNGKPQDKIPDALPL